MSIVLEDFRAMERNTLRGFARVRLPSGMVVHDVGVHRKEDRVWASPPGRPMVGKDGVQLRSKDGKAQFSPTISFVDRATADRFSEAVVAAVRAAHPEALR